jgi:hypothetical protein
MSKTLKFVEACAIGLVRECKEFSELHEKVWRLYYAKALRKELKPTTVLALEQVCFAVWEYNRTKRSNELSYGTIAYAMRGLPKLRQQRRFNFKAMLRHSLYF